jgi:hypothetical protein
MNTQLIKQNGKDVLIINRDNPKACMLFMEYTTINRIEYEIEKNDYDNTFEITSEGSFFFLVTAKNHIDANL